MSDENVLKIVILGEGRVGKTSMLSQYFNKKFDSSEKSTVNPSFYEKKVNSKGKTVNFKFWDTAGQEQFNAISTIYYQNSVGAILVYDITIPETFEKVETWMNTLQEVVGKNITCLVVGNKYDLFDKNKSFNYTDKIKNFCDKYNCKHINTSAKTGYNINEAFKLILDSVLNKINQGGEVSGRKGKKLKIETSENKGNEKKGCC